MLYPFKAITLAQALYMIQRSCAVVARTDHNGIGFFQRLRIVLQFLVGTVEEILYSARHVPKILRRAQHDCIAPPHILRRRIHGSFQMPFRFFRAAHTGRHSFGKPPGVAGLGMEYNQYLDHAIIELYPSLSVKNILSFASIDMY